MDGWLYDEYRYSWSPDGRYLVFASMATVNNTDGGEVDVPLPIPRKGKRTGEPLILTNTTPREWTLLGVFAESSKTVTTERMAADGADKQTDSPARRNQLFVVDSRIHSVRQVTTDDSIYIDPQWSPDGKTIVCASSEGRPLYGYGPDTMNIYAIDVATGTKVALTTGPGRKWMPSWSPDGGQVAYWGGKNGMLSLYVVAAAGGDGTNVSSKRDRSVWRFAWSSDSRAIVMIYVDGVSDPIVRIELASGVVTPISEATSAVRMALTTSAVGSFAWEENGPSAPAVIRIWSPEQNASFPLVNLNPKVTDWRLGRQEVVQWKNQAGDELVRRGIADPTRMCLFGHSNGGAVVNQVVTMTNRFRCAVSVAAALSTDWSMPLFLNTDAKVIADLAGATPWEEPETYVKLSASYR